MTGKADKLSGYIHNRSGASYFTIASMLAHSKDRNSRHSQGVPQPKQDFRLEPHTVDALC